MAVVETVSDYLSGFLSQKQAHQADSSTLFYRATLTDEVGNTRAEYNERARTLHSDLTSTLTESGHFTKIHLDRTIDPYIALGTSHPNLSLSDHDERIYDLAEKAKQRHPWPEGTEYDTDDLLADFQTPRAAQSAMANIVTYEVTVKGTPDTNSKWGSPAALENARRLTAEFVAETDDVKSVERFRSVGDGWYSFRFRDHEIRVRALAKTNQPNVEWKVGYTDGCPRGLGWASETKDDQYGHSNGRLYLDKQSNESGQSYFREDIHSIPMPKQIVESLSEDARMVEPKSTY